MLKFILSLYNNALFSRKVVAHDNLYSEFQFILETNKQLNLKKRSSSYVDNWFEWKVINVGTCAYKQVFRSLINTVFLIFILSVFLFQVEKLSDCSRMIMTYILFYPFQFYISLSDLIWSFTIRSYPTLACICMSDLKWSYPVLSHSIWFIPILQSPMIFYSLRLYPTRTYQILSDFNII